MKITRAYQESDVIDSIVTKQTITIEIEPGDDPQGYINGLIIRGRLEYLLQGFGDPSAFANPDLDEGSFWTTLTSYGYIANRTESVYDFLLVIARDQRGLSWRTIATATEIPQATIRRRVKATRQQLAETGRWINADGIQYSDPENAKMHADILDFSDDRESAITIGDRVEILSPYPGRKTITNASLYKGSTGIVTQRDSEKPGSWFVRIDRPKLPDHMGCETTFRASELRIIRDFSAEA